MLFAIAYEHEADLEVRGPNELTVTSYEAGAKP